MATPTILTPKKLAQEAIDVAPAQTIYTAPDVAIIQTMDICNTTAGNLRVRVYLVDSGGAAGTDNALMYDTVVGSSGGTLSWTGPHYMAANDFIAVEADGAGLTITISGMETV